MKPQVVGATPKSRDDEKAWIINITCQNQLILVMQQKLGIINAYSHRPENNPFASKIICGECNKVFARKGWRSSTGIDRKVWQCSERYKVKGVMGCANRHVEEETLRKAYLIGSLKRACPLYYDVIS